MHQKKNYKKYNGGYTIIETMIAITLFMIVTTLGLGALLNANMLHNKTADMRSIMDNLSFVMEDMSRNIRIGYNYHCLTAGQTSLPTTPKSCAVGYGIAFEMPEGTPDDNTDQWLYWVESTANSNGTNTHKLFKTINGQVSGRVQLTPDEVVITSITPITVLGAESPDAGNNQQPFVTIRLAGTITYKDVVTPFAIQTAVSQRKVDI